MLARCLLFLLFLSVAQTCFAQEQVATEPLATQPQGGIIIADLEQQLTAGLKIRREQEQQFVAAVMKLVEQGRLPTSLVKSVFHWSRRKNSKAPYPYFERAMRLTAEKIGVEIVVPASG